ncbi:MAG: hypothetical protein CMC04_05095 [Flavobacteriaceae bacterium]|nr:hypothetical protein [Flavobacteriaceae bacterium]
MSLNLHLSELDSSTTLSTQGTFEGVDTASISGTDVALYYAMPIEHILPTFKFYTDGVTDIVTEGVTISTGVMRNFIGDANSDSNTASVGDLYAVNSSTSAVYAENVISDISSTGSAQAPDAALHFLQQLALKVFGSTEAIDLFSNEAAIATSFGTAVETCASTVSGNFNSAGSATIYANLSSGNTNLQVAKRIWDQLRYSTLPRFSLEYGAALASGTLGDSTGCPVTGGASQSGSPTVDVYVTNTTIDSIQVNATGSGFVNGDTVTITSTSPAFTITITLNPVQAAILNGKLDSTSGVSFPLEVDDQFHIKFTIDNHSSQVDANGTNLTTAGTPARTIVDLVINLV